MTRILTKEQATQLDRTAMDTFGIPGHTLMKNAGIQVAENAREMVSNMHNPSVVIIVGKGNNGGDGFAAGFQLSEWGYPIHIHSLVEGENIHGDSKIFYELCESKHLFMTYGESISHIDPPDLIIDCIFGTGIRLPIRDNDVSNIEWINGAGSKVLSIDIPSGLDANTGMVNPLAVIADRTITMGHPKLGMVMNHGKDYCGEIVVADIGFPDINQDLIGGHNWSIFEESRLKISLEKPRRNTYKHQQGKVLIIAGSKGMTGAAILTTMAALRAGAGLTITCVPSSLNTIFEKHIIEGMTFPLPDQEKGYFLKEHYKAIKEKCNWADAIIIGPGLGGEKETIDLVTQILQNTEKPVVLDADGLRCLQNNTSNDLKLKSDIIVTPHLGELSSLLGKKIEDVQQNPVTSVEEWIKDFAGISVIKTVPVLTCSKNKLVVNSSGNPGLATAGTGDVLSGIIGSLIAQGIALEDAAQCGVYIHGKVADNLIAQKGYRGLLATDLIEELPNTLKVYEAI